MQSISKRFFLLFFMSFLFLLSVNNASADMTNAQRTTLENALSAAQKAATPGPTKIALLDKATLNLPKEYMFVPRKEAAALLEATGNKTSSDFFGVILPNSMEWMLTIDYLDSGYVTDSDAKKWNANDLLESLKKGTTAANEDRKKQGFPTLEIKDWIQKPTYDSKTHKLIWALEGLDSNSSNFVNYNTYALGRTGYFELNLLTSSEEVEKNKVEANQVLSSINFSQGQRYEDYVKGKDHLAAYGLAALVTGIAAKKLGLLALAGVFFIKIWKMVVIAFAVFFGSIKKLFKRKA